MCEIWLCQDTQHRTQHNDGSVLEIMPWRYTLTPWRTLQKSLAGSRTQGEQFIHTSALECQGCKIWETSFNPLSVSSLLYSVPCTDKVNSLETNTDKSTVLVQALHVHKPHSHSINGLILLWLAGWSDSGPTNITYSFVFLKVSQIHGSFSVQPLNFLIYSPTTSAWCLLVSYTVMNVFNSWSRNIILPSS